MGGKREDQSTMLESLGYLISSTADPLTTKLQGEVIDLTAPRQFKPWDRRGRF